VNIYLKFRFFVFAHEKVSSKIENKEIIDVKKLTLSITSEIDPFKTIFESDCTIKEVIHVMPQLLEKISHVLQTEYPTKQLNEKLSNNLNLKRKQNSQSLVVMNQQYGRRLDVMKNYFFATLEAIHQPKKSNINN
jgi:hypothetical protein